MYAIIVSQFNQEIIDGLLKGALKGFAEAKIKKSNIKIVKVPGAWEIPIAVHKLLAVTKRRRPSLSDGYDAIITLGAVIKGETTHDYWINHAVFPALQEVSEEYLIPVTLGIITCNTWKQAQARSKDNQDNRGYAAAKAAMEMVKILKNIK